MKSETYSMVGINKQGYCQKVYQPTLVMPSFFLWLNLVGNVLDCFMAQKRKKTLSFQSFWRWQMVEGVTGWSKSHFQHVHLFQGEGTESGGGEGKWCNSGGEAKLWRLLDNKHCADSGDFSPLFVSQSQTAGHDFLSDIRCHRWFSLCLTTCQSHYCHLWERHTHAEQLTHWQNEK